jgi:hypothetical protein
VGGVIAASDLRLNFLRFTVFENSVILFCLFWMALIPDSSSGVLRPLIEDISTLHPNEPMSAARLVIIGVIAFVFLSDIFQTQRGIQATWGLLFSLSGQALLATITVVYTLTGRLSPIALYGYCGVFLLSLVGMVTVIQSYQPAVKYPVKALIYPLLSTLMALLGVSLIAWQDSAIARFIQEAHRFGGVVFLALIVPLAWGHGQLRQNHLTPDEMAKRLIGVAVFAFLSAAFFTATSMSSLLGVCVNGLIVLLGVFFALIQAKDYTPPIAAGDHHE